MSDQLSQDVAGGDSSIPPQSLPSNPDLRHFKDQARDLLSEKKAPNLTKAQFLIARAYGFPSWPKLKAHVDSLHEVGRLKAAIDANDLATVKAMMTANPALHRAPMGYANNGPLTWVAECRVPRIAPTPTRLEMARWMIENGSDIHQGGDGPLMRAALSDLRIAMMELLVEHGADVNAKWIGSSGPYPIILACCETLQSKALRWLVEHGADPNVKAGSYGTPLSMVFGTYSRDSAGKHACLAALTSMGFELPDSPTMALHAGRLDLLEQHLVRDPGLIARQFPYSEIYPPEWEPGDWGLTLTPLNGVTLLHMAVEFEDLGAVKWLIERGASPNARASVDADGFGGHTPLFHTAVSMGRRTDDEAMALLAAGGNPNDRATLRKRLLHMGDPEQERMREFHDVTAVGYALRYQVPAWVNEAAIAVMIEAGGRE